MRTKLTDHQNYIRVHKTLEVTESSPFVNGTTPNPNGLLSPLIFGITPEERRLKMGVIDLGDYYIRPLVYKRVIKRTYRNIDKLLSGQTMFWVSADGELMEVTDDSKIPSGVKKGTGIRFFYDNFESIKIKNFEDAEDDSETLKDIKRLYNRGGRDNIFSRKILVYPIAFRDVNVGDSSTGLDDVNYLYQQLLMYKDIIEKNSGGMMFNVEDVKFRIQTTLVSIYDYFASLCFGKDGIQRKRVMGKTVDYAARTVISAPSFTSDEFGDNAINLDTCGLPLSACVDMYSPFVLNELESFTKYLFDSGYLIKNNGSLLDKNEFDEFFNRNTLSDMMDKYVNSWGERFSTIPISKDGSVIKVNLRNGDSIVEGHELTLVELMYICAYGGVEERGKHNLWSRYPIQDYLGVMGSRTHVLNLEYKCTMNVNDTMDFKYYPDILLVQQKMKDLENDMMREELVSSIFEETTQISNLHLEGIGGDYDGDKTGNRSVFSDEATTECEKKLNEPLFMFNMNGRNVKMVGREASQALYSFSVTKPTGKSVKPDMVSEILNMEPKAITKSFLFNRLRLADTLKKKRLNDCRDTVVIPRGGYKGINTDTVTSLGKLIINKVIFQFMGEPYHNVEFNRKNVEAIFTKMADDVFNSIIDISKYKECLNIFEDFAFSLGGFINPSIETGMMIENKEITKMRTDLLEEHREKLEAGDVATASMVESALVKKASDLHKDCDMYELFDSGSKAKMGNEYKKMFLMVGAVPKDLSSTTFHVSPSNFSNGTSIKEQHALANQMIIAGYFRAKNPQIGGYFAKQGASIFQSLMLDKYGTDCGSDGVRTLHIEESNKAQIIDRYCVTGDSTVLITMANVNDYVGKTIKIRTPTECRSKFICNKCAGDRFYKLTGVRDDIVPAGLFLTKTQTELTQKSLKKVHVMTLRTVPINDMNDYVM
ncbi:MAG: hypothetical protein ACRCZ9_03955 [Fusobacteriaceae bacterium]